MKTLNNNSIVSAVVAVLFVLTQVMPAGFAGSPVPVDPQDLQAAVAEVSAEGAAADANATPVQTVPQGVNDAFLTDGPLSAGQVMTEVGIGDGPIGSGDTEISDVSAVLPVETINAGDAANTSPVVIPVMDIVREIPASPELLERAQDILGDGVVRGMTTVLWAPGSANVTRFYDAAGNLVGSYTNNPSLGPSNIPTWRDADGVDIVQEIPASPELLAEAQDILGAGVVVGVALVHLNIEGSGVTTYFYNANGNLMGSYTTNGSLGPNNIPTWRDADGQILLAEETEIPDAVQSYVDALHSALGDAFNISVNFYEVAETGEGLYEVNVARPIAVEPCAPGSPICNTTTMVAPGHLLTMSFTLAADGTLVPDSVTAGYSGISNVNGEFLSHTMSALQMTLITPQHMMTPPQYMARAVQLMSQINIREASDSVIRFSFEGRNYVATRNADGTVNLEEGLPVEVQNYVDDLQSRVGGDFQVIAQPDGDSYRITVTSTLNDAVVANGLQRLSFTLRGLDRTSPGGNVDVVTFWEIDPASLQVSYNGASAGTTIRPDAALLFGALGQLANPPCPDGQLCPTYVLSLQEAQLQVIRMMTQITVTSVSNNQMRFSYNGTNYLARRDAHGNIVIRVVGPGNGANGKRK